MHAELSGFRLGIYLNGLGGVKPAYPLSYRELEARVPWRRQPIYA